MTYSESQIIAQLTELKMEVTLLQKKIKTINTVSKKVENILGDSGLSRSMSNMMIERTYILRFKRKSFKRKILYEATISYTHSCEEFILLISHFLSEVKSDVEIDESKWETISQEIIGSQVEPCGNTEKDSIHTLETEANKITKEFVKLMDSKAEQIEYLESQINTAYPSSSTVSTTLSTTTLTTSTTISSSVTSSTTVSSSTPASE